MKLVVNEVKKKIIMNVVHTRQGTKQQNYVCTSNTKYTIEEKLLPSSFQNVQQIILKTLVNGPCCRVGKKCTYIWQSLMAALSKVCE